MKQPCFHQKIIGDVLSLYQNFSETFFNNNRNISVLKCEKHNLRKSQISYYRTSEYFRRMEWLSRNFLASSQFEISGKNHISQNVFLPSIIYPSLPRKRFQGSSSFISPLVGRDEKRAPLKTPTWEAKSTRQRKRKNIGTSSFLARGKSRMLSTDPLFTLFYFLNPSLSMFYHFMLYHSMFY